MAKQFRNRYDKMRVSAPKSEDLPAQQQFKKETDINTIVSRYMKGGLLGNPAATRRPIFGDFSSLDYHEMRNQIADIDQNFAQLSARVRSRFQNDPYQLIRFLDKPENLPEAIKLGLAVDPNPPRQKAVQLDLVKASEKAEIPPKAPSTP